MKITSKGQVTIPQSVREQAHLHPYSEVEFEVRATGEHGDAFEVVIRPVTAPASTVRSAFERVRLLARHHVCTQLDGLADVVQGQSRDRRTGDGVFHSHDHIRRQHGPCGNARPHQPCN